MSNKLVSLENVTTLIDGIVTIAPSTQQFLINRIQRLPITESKELWIDVREHLEKVRAVYNGQANTETDELLKNVAYLTAIELTEIITGLTPPTK